MQTTAPGQGKGKMDSRQREQIRRCVKHVVCSRKARRLCGCNFSAGDGRGEIRLERQIQTKLQRASKLLFTGCVTSPDWMSLSFPILNMQTILPLSPGCEYYIRNVREGSGAELHTANERTLVATHLTVSRPSCSHQIKECGLYPVMESLQES